MSRVPFWRRQARVPVAELERSRNPVRAGIVLLVIIAIAIYFSFEKKVPFTHGFRLKAEFASAINIQAKSPVRIAGVNVGQVTAVKRQGNTGLVTMELESRGLPIHSDATLKIRPRTFLEGNWFVELEPGTPSAPVSTSVVEKMRSASIPRKTSAASIAGASIGRVIWRKVAIAPAPSKRAAS